MSRFHKKSLAILPLLSILSISPSELQINNHSRGPASAVVEDIGRMNPALEMRAAPPEVIEDKKEDKKVELPKYEALVSRVDRDSLLKDEKLDKEKFLIKEAKLKEKIAEAKKNPLQDQESIEKLVIELLIVEADLKSLKEKELLKIEEEEKASLLALADHKKVIEEILVNLEKSEVQIAEEKEVKEEVMVVEEKKDDKKEDKKEEAPVVADDKTGKSDKPVVVKSEEICQADDKYDVLSKQMEKLIADQSQIMLAMVNMTQTMMQMMQQQMQQMQSFQMPNMASIYQYQPQTTAGNWVYHPSGFQPGQSNIFAQQMQVPAQQQPQGFYPEQSHMAQAPMQPQQIPMGPQSNWNLAPQMNFQNNPAYSPMQVNPGNFGGLSFNLEQSTGAPQLPMPTLTMI